MARVRCTVSAGGVLIRAGRSGPEFLLVQRRKHIEPKWRPVLRQLPKGGRNPGEGRRQTALREVREETGYMGIILRKAGTATWCYEREHRSWKESVHYYWMKPAAGALGARDGEFESAIWVPLFQNPIPLSYPEERALIRQIRASCPPV